MFPQYTWKQYPQLTFFGTILFSMCLVKVALFVRINNWPMVEDKRFGTILIDITTNILHHNDDVGYETIDVSNQG